MATVLEIQIAKSKNNVSKIKIMISNVSKSCDLLLDAWENDDKIIHFLNWEWITYNCLNNLIFHIGFQLILKCSNIIDLLFNDKHNNYTSNRINNIEFFSCILFHNRLIMKKIFNNKSKWKPFMIFWRIIISHNKVYHIKYSSLLHLIAKSQPFWQIKHFLFIIKNRWEIVLCKAMYTGFTKKFKAYQPKFSEIIYILLQNTKRSFVIINTSTKKLKKIWINFQARLNHEANKITKRVEKHIKKKNECIDKLIWISWKRYVTNKLRIVPIMLDTMDPPKTKKMFMGRKVKICTYYKCNTLKVYGCHIKMKRCKGCKLTYYCSRECYKRDWNSKHRYECSKLSARM